MHSELLAFLTLKTSCFLLLLEQITTPTVSFSSMQFSYSYKLEYKSVCTPFSLGPVDLDSFRLKTAFAS